MKRPVYISNEICKKIDFTRMSQNLMIHYGPADCAVGLEKAVKNSILAICADYSLDINDILVSVMRVFTGDKFHVQLFDSDSTLCGEFMLETKVDHASDRRYEFIYRVKPYIPRSNYLSGSTKMDLVGIKVDVSRFSPDEPTALAILEGVILLDDAMSDGDNNVVEYRMGLIGDSSEIQIQATTKGSNPLDNVAASYIGIFSIPVGEAKEVQVKALSISKFEPRQKFEFKISYNPAANNQP